MTENKTTITTKLVNCICPIFRFATQTELSFDAIFLPFHWLKAHHLTWLPTNNGLLMRIVVQLRLAANNILLMRKRNHP